MNLLNYRKIMLEWNFVKKWNYYEIILKVDQLIFVQK